MKPTWTQHETTMNPTWNQHETNEISQDDFVGLRIRAARSRTTESTGYEFVVRDSSWFHAGFMLVSCWFHVGFMLGSCWFHVGFMLDSCWTKLLGCFAGIISIVHSHIYNLMICLSDLCCVFYHLIPLTYIFHCPGWTQQHSRTFLACPSLGLCSNG